ncbi:Cupin-like domain-containing protein [Arachidicoccus rhizosphaerae]|uniref:Cupin-like domain-containing protein n=1 Tax=Arachidicoccus rhizosphaerae TaxID=551991 RepID=A0A1H3XTK3_9BACT|nr:cupin-like domain-containing protein [Arachidicoccus rhizosphaerae]SEA02643.1 Cupin-like domain-containing protein [Arachidicoccus rhizosphaerae]
MRLKNIDTVASISPEDFKKKYYNTRTPLVIKDLAKSWPAYQKWTWDYFKEKVGQKEVGIYNNVKSDAYTPINKADDYVKFGDYIDMIRKGPAEWRIFLFNIFSHAPELSEDFSWPTHLMNGFVKRAPMLFTGGQGAVTHMHFDIDLSHIVHTQFIGRKRVLLFPYEQQHLLYRKPFEVLSLADYSHYYDPEHSKLDINKFPALQYAEGYDLTLEHGDTLFMPAGYWHHMEYLDSGFAMSLRALNNEFTGKLKGVWNIIGMRNIDTLMKKIRPHQWYDWKEKQIFARSEKEILNNVS